MKNEKMISVKPLVLERALRDAGLIRFETDSHVVELRALLDTPAPCAHEWTDDGGHLIACTACGAQEDHDPGWRDMENAPKDGTMLRLLVSFDEHSTEDADEAPTIGANNFDNDGEDAWRFAGWCWTHDHFTQGVGTPVGWLPMIEASASTAKLDRIAAERDALQLLLNERDEQVHSLEQRRHAEQQACMAAERRVQGLQATLKDLISAVRSINRSPAYRVTVIGDEEPQYRQRKEWIEWVLELCDKASAGLE